VAKRTDSPGAGTLAAGALTAASMLVVSTVAALVGVVIAREFGRTEETDGFFAAYGVFIVVTIAAQAIRVAVLPALTRARAERRLAGEVAGFALALAVVAVPLIVVSELESSAIGGVLTGGRSDISQESAAEALRWMVPAAALYLFAGLAASGLAALDNYATAAFGFALGSAAALVLILLRVDPDGIIAVAWGMGLNGAVSALVPIVALAFRARRQQMPSGAARPSGPPLRSRLGGFGAAAALPLGVQMLYIVCLPFAGRLGPGAVTSFGYAYIGAASLVTISAFSLGLVTSVPLARAGLGPERTARHVVSTSWIALVLVGGAAGVFALAGADLVQAVLGNAYGGDVGAKVGQLVVVLSPWMVALVGVSVAFPLAFIADRIRRLPWIAVAALALQVPLAWALARVLELDGLALALTVSTFFVFVALLRELSALAGAARGFIAAAVVVSGLSLAAFVPPALILGAPASAAFGLILYVALLALIRPRGLILSWQYLRTLA